MRTGLFRKELILKESIPGLNAILLSNVRTAHFVGAKVSNKAEETPGFDAHRFVQKGANSKTAFFWPQDNSCLFWAGTGGVHIIYDWLQRSYSISIGVFH